MSSAVEVSPGRESASAKGQLSFRKDPEPDGTAAGSASPSPATPLQHAREEQRVVLRVEVATKGQASGQGCCHGAVQGTTLNPAHTNHVAYAAGTVGC